MRAWVRFCGTLGKWRWVFFIGAIFSSPESESEPAAVSCSVVASVCSLASSLSSAHKNDGSVHKLLRQISNKATFLESFLEPF